MNIQPADSMLLESIFLSVYLDFMQGMWNSIRKKVHTNIKIPYECKNVL